MRLGNIYRMTKEDLKDKLGKYCQLTFTLKHSKFKVITFFELFGHIIRIEDKNILFKDNYNHEFIIPIKRIIKITIEKKRRKLVEYKELKEIEIIKKENKMLEKKIKLLEMPENPNYE